MLRRKYLDTARRNRRSDEETRMCCNITLDLGGIESGRQSDVMRCLPLATRPVERVENLL